FGAPTFVRSKISGDRFLHFGIAEKGSALESQFFGGPHANELVAAIVSIAQHERPRAALGDLQREAGNVIVPVDARSGQGSAGVRRQALLLRYGFRALKRRLRRVALARRGSAYRERMNLPEPLGPARLGLHGSPR